MQLWQYCLLVTAKSLYMLRTLSASIIRSINNCRSSHWCAAATDLGHACWIYIFPTHGTHQWLLLQLSILLMMDAESVRNM